MKLSAISEPHVVVISPDRTLLHAAEEMRRTHVGALVVVEERSGGMWPVGIVTDRDIAFAITASANGPAPRVRDAMTCDVIVASEHDDLFDGLAKMRHFGVRRLPIVALDGRLRGIITLDDIIDVLSRKLREAAAVMPRERQVETQLVVEASKDPSNST